MLLEQLGRVPKVGDQVELSGIDFRVEAIEGRSVSQVSLKMQAGMAEALEETS
jgi:CBS domain containing-hemolysin-like protein